MSEKDIVNKILSIIGNFNLSENIQLKELTSLYIKQQEEIERLNNIINEIKEYFEDLEIFAPSRDIKYDILDIIEGSDKE